MEWPVRSTSVLGDGAPGRSWAFVVGFALYSTVMLVAILATTGVESTGTSTFAVLGFVFLAMAAVAFVRQGKAESPEASPLGRRLREVTSAGVYVIYTGAYVVYLSNTTDASTVRLFGRPLVAVSLVQSTVLVVILGVFNQKFSYDVEHIPPDSQPEYLRFALQNWWRWAHLAMSGFVAFGIGIAASLYSQQLGSEVVIHASTSFVGVAALAWFALKKNSRVRAQVAEALAEE